MIQRLVYIISIPDITILSGAGFSIASQLLSGTPIDHINCKDVGISAAAGALSAIPSVGLLGSTLISRSANAASDNASGNTSISKVGTGFGIGFVVGLGTGIKLPKDMSINECKVPSGY